jgi:hypothetical protein
MRPPDGTVPIEGMNGAIIQEQFDLGTYLDELEPSVSKPDKLVMTAQDELHPVHARGGNARTFCACEHICVSTLP